MSVTIELPNIPNENQNIYTYVYKVTFYTENVKVEPLAITHVIKECNYSTNFNPVFIMNIQVTKKDLFLLKRNQKELCADIILEAKEYMRVPSGESKGSTMTSLVNTEIISSGTFQPIFSSTAFDERYREDDYENEEKLSADGKTGDTRESNRISIDVNFEDIIAVNSKKTLFNIVAEKGATVGTILQYIVDVLPVKGAIIDMPDNDYTLGETIIPPGNLVPTLRNIQYNIGIYENGLLYFYDDDVLYILNKYALNHDCISGDKQSTHVYITEIDKMLGGVTVRGTDPSNNYEPTYIGPIITKAFDNEIASAELDGNNFVFSSFRQGLSAVQYVDNKPVSSNSKKVAMVLKRNIETYKHSIDKNILNYDELGNLYNMASYFNELEASVKQMSVQVDNINVTDFRPNKFIYLHFLDLNKDMRLGGIYHINDVTFVFLPINLTETKEMSCVCSLSLSRRNN
jgi:hypothetical protein